MSVATIPQTHHGITVGDLDGMEGVLRGLGYTDTQPGAPEPLWFHDRDGDDVGQRTACVLGDGYRTRYVENPRNHHQICLIEVVPQSLLEHPFGGQPAEGDLTITIPSADPERARALMGDREGQRFEFVAEDVTPTAVVHYSPVGWDVARTFYVDVLGVGVDERDGAATLVDIGGPLTVRIDPAVRPLPSGYGKRYRAANHFRLLHVELDAVEERAAASSTVSFLLGPSGGFAFIHGPRGEAIELFDRSLTRR